MSDYVNPYCAPESRQRHVHELLGSVQIAGGMCNPHNHRFATVSGEAESIGNGDHVHQVKFRTDFYDGHYHEFIGYSGGAIPVGDGHHVHYASAETDMRDGHRHAFRVAALIDDPIGD